MWAGAIRSGRFPRYVYLPHGPTARSVAAMTAALEDAVSSARERSLDFVRSEPAGAGAGAALEATGAMVSRSIQPRWTWVLDLGPDAAALRRGLSAGIGGPSTPQPGGGSASARAPTRATSRCSYSCRKPPPLQAGIAARRSRTTDRGVDADAGRCGCDLHRRSEGSAVAAALCFDFAGTRYYAHAVSDPEAVASSRPPRRSCGE